MPVRQPAETDISAGNFQRCPAWYALPAGRDRCRLWSVDEVKLVEKFSDLLTRRELIFLNETNVRSVNAIVLTRNGKFPQTFRLPSGRSEPDGTGVNA